MLILVDQAGLDEERVRAWVVVRMMVNVWWAITSGAPDVARWITQAVTLVKAVQR
jgi:streptomycin 6-kinase